MFAVKRVRCLCSKGDSLKTLFTCQNVRFSKSSAAFVRLNYEEFSSKDVRNDLEPIVIAHGMLGSLANWTSISKNLHRQTGRRVIAFDARNHGFSEHTDTMSYAEMSDDVVDLLHRKLGIRSAILVGHSMGGRTIMYTALTRPDVASRIVVVDISPVNRKFDVTDATEWNMSHFFHTLKSVRFPEDLPISKVRVDVDSQLAKRIQDPGVRAWLLMNLNVNPADGKIGWRVNLDAIHRAFDSDIVNFPYDKFEESRVTFDKPALFVGGASSEYLPVHHHPDILDIFPRAEFVYVQGAGHWVHAQKPTEFIDIVLKFLGS